jgi:nicotinamidase-related amidase
METSSDVLIVIDLQNGVCYDGEHLFDLQNLLTKVNKRIALYRELHKPIIFVQHCDEELVPEEELWALHADLDVQTVWMLRLNLLMDWDMKTSWYRKQPLL